jgi:hypothetical protein
MNLDDYDGIKLNAEIKRLFKKVASHTTQAKYIKAACKALGFKERLKHDSGSHVENKAIVQWLLDNASALRLKPREFPELLDSSGATSRLGYSQVVELLSAPEEIREEVTATTPTPKTRNKVKRDKRFDAFTRISFNVTGNTQRQHISLELEFIKALELIAPDNRNKWLADTVADYIAKNGIESTTRIIKSAIVNELIERAKI